MCVVVSHRRVRFYRLTLPPPPPPAWCRQRAETAAAAVVRPSLIHGTLVPLGSIPAVLARRYDQWAQRTTPLLAVTRHIRTSHRQMAIECQRCGDRFTNFKSHLKHTHTHIHTRQWHNNRLV